MSFVLGIDIGTSRIAAATARIDDSGSVSVTPFALGRKGDSVATVVFVSDDGELLFGDTAERRGVARPERLVREFKRNIGDDIPLVVGGRSLSSEELYAQIFASVVDAVTEREGSRPEAISLTHPTAWGPHRLGLIQAALRRLGIDDVSMITEPEAAARHYEAARPIEAGGSLAVYDLGGGTFDSVVLRKGADSDFTVVGDPVGLEDLGGADFDDAVFRHVIATSGLDVSALSVDDADTRLALSQLRRECIDAKEALSFDSDATIPVLIQASRSSVRLTRSEFEHMIDAPLDRTLGALENAIDSAGLTPDQLEAILLIGGSSRIPLVAQRLSERFDRPLAIDADPKAAIALGAARSTLIQLIERRPAASNALTTFDAAVAGTAVEAASAPTASELVLANTAGALAPVRDAQTHAAKHRSPFLLAGAVAVIAGAIIFTGTIAAGSRLPEEDTASSTNGAGASDSSEFAPFWTADRAANALGPVAKGLGPVLPGIPGAPGADSDTNGRDDDTGDSPRRAPAESSTGPRPVAPRNSPPAASNPSTQTVDQPADPAPPATDPPITDPPATDPPITDPPVTDPPVTDPPITYPPVTDPPVTDPPITDPPITDPPVTDPPTTDPPATDPASAP
jgi:molecular chaperone DnaK